eukprot:TRINITY_DN13045_c0_g1_i4.p1 TRINITY_DN13045_c0_g1~~TRINITY_DN13045_c0_g1_i4.p1  ORF type:complete len:170 (+),score=32.02 TRINITY_DN13045_c0_g1_i4:2-511(+)
MKFKHGPETFLGEAAFEVILRIGVSLGLDFDKHEDLLLIQAVPMGSLVKRVEGIMTNGHFRRPYIGLTLEADARSERLTARGGGGVLVAKVERGSPAGEGGLRAGDVIKMIGSSSIRTTDDVVTALDACEPGESLQFLVSRPDSGNLNGHFELVEVELWITVGEAAPPS